ncbi:receptor-type tyrosine-protein phosphatase kappa-like isoform X1 [Dinothrombium tinctorium]|uniref:Receptor-type tyrosine-protein phosphatase kappa-like isoform X1 n=1 Tax=Dinothrombium tinctorium TaxID=1965070 RepID=A0A443R9E9_9ACAR|nr:receptor-type tyrosine-protein phosphatase kappa-like isoform X1 [Dinothrombium tinctorium]
MSTLPKLDSKHRSKSVPPPKTREDDERSAFNVCSSDNIRSESRTSINTLHFFLNLKACKSISSPSELSPVTKFHLSLLNSGCISLNENTVRNVSRLFAETPLDFRSFGKYLQLQKKYNVLLQIEFNVASKVESFSTRHALKEANEMKNCNKKCLPYDYNRVILDPLPDVPHSDYINASYVDSLLKPNAYIASQGPMEDTINDFWRMVWKEKSYIIIMLTKVFDFIRVLCSQYWPFEANKAEVYGSIEVTLLEEDVLADFVIRTLRLRNVSKKERQGGCVNCSHYDEEGEKNESEENEDSDIENERLIYQFHYHQWPIHTCPFKNSMLHFRRRVRLYMSEVSKVRTIGPVIVHCSDGCGRTGTYICIDANLELGDEDNMYDVFGYTKKMKTARKGMIETVDQYKFVYDCLEEAYISGKTWFPVSELLQQMKYKSAKNPLTRQNDYQREFQVSTKSSKFDKSSVRAKHKLDYEFILSLNFAQLSKFKFSNEIKIVKMTPKLSIGECAGGHRIENRDKNRDVAIVPPDNHRPYLTSFQSNDNTDYINAVFVDGYTRSREYIVTEWPILHTLADFWSLIYDHDCNSVILLANPDDQTVSKTLISTASSAVEKRSKKTKFSLALASRLQQTYPIFWPSEKEKRRKYGPVFTVELVSFNHYPNIKTWIFRVTKKVVSLQELMSGVKGVPKTTQLFQITCWPISHKVPTSTNALVELVNMVERWRQRTTYGPVCVISPNGKSRVGVYCAANLAIEQVVQHGEVDVFQAVKTVRRHRRQLIENITEYKYCYDLILHYVLHYLN